MLINTARSLEELGMGEFAAAFAPGRLMTLPATEIAREHLGRPLPNAVLLGGFAALTGRSRSTRWSKRSASGSRQESATATSPRPRRGFEPVEAAAGGGTHA